jgi:hypothetical protein
MKAAHRQRLIQQLPRTDNESTESNDKLTDDEEASFDITREAFRDRPSLATAPNHHESSPNQQAQRSQSALDLEEQSFDITRVAFPDRPALAISQQHQVSELEMEQAQHSSSVEDQKKMVDKSVTPKAELYQFYISRGFTVEQAAELTDFYTVWTNEESLFTCIFYLPNQWREFHCRQLDTGR